MVGTSPAAQRRLRRGRLRSGCRPGPARSRPEHWRASAVGCAWMTFEAKGWSGLTAALGQSRRPPTPSRRPSSAPRGSDQVRHPDRDDRVPGYQREYLAGPRGTGGTGGSAPSRPESTALSPPPRRPAPAATSSSGPALRSGCRPVLPRTRASWA